MAKPLIQKSSSCSSSADDMNQTWTQKSASKDGPQLPWDDYRLPSHIRPTSYDLTLNPNLETGLFNGEVLIATQVTQPTDYFIVHVKFLNITETQLESETGHILTLKDTFPYPKNEFFVVTLSDPADVGKYILHFTFDGSLVNGMVGFYRSEYKTESGEKRYLATSKFEPTYARRAYPCFDEPNFRANFTNTLTHPKGYFALSNMPPVETTSRADGLLETKFQTSVTMPTYLSCFIVCDFNYTEVKTKDGKLFRVYSTPNQVENTKRALNLGSQIQDFYVEYYGIPYPLPKQDLIAIPDFVSGAMEHWGLITFRETNLLFHPNESSSINEERVASVIGHELAHMWFGNLVTMNWWDDLWLNEGFATFMEYVGVSSVETSWHRNEMILVDDIQPSMIKDASINSHPIIQPVKHPDEITEIFDSISYSKGASVLRMLDSFVGRDDFRNGIKNYLEKYSFGNARTIDLWNELSKTSKMKLDIPAIMDTWTKQMGFPIIHISRDPQRPNYFTARQERFYFIREHSEKVNKSESPFGYLWAVPLTYRQPDSTVETVWLHDSEKSFEVLQATNEVVKFNVDQTGFYKVNYEESIWNDITQLLLKKYQTLSRADRTHLLDDAFTLSNGGYLSYSIAFNLSKYLTNETDYLPWRAASNAFLSISPLLTETDIYPLFKKYLLNICSPVYEKLGWKDEGDHLTRLLRPIILDILCHHGHQQCLQEASQALQSWKNGQHISPNLKVIVYHYGISNSQNADDWTYMWEKYLTTVSAQEKIKLLYGLAFTQEPALLHRYIEYAMDTTKIRSQDFFTVLNYISSNPLGNGMVWDFVREKWNYLVERFTLNDRYLGLLVPQVTRNFAKEIRLQEMIDFFNKYPEAGAGGRARHQAMERVKINVEWLKHYKNDIKKWLEEHVAL